MKLLGDGIGLQAPGQIVGNHASVHDRAGHAESCGAEAGPLMSGLGEDGAKGVEHGFEAGKLASREAEPEYRLKTRLGITNAFSWPFIRRRFGKPDKCAFGTANVPGKDHDLLGSAR